MVFAFRIGILRVGGSGGSIVRSLTLKPFCPVTGFFIIALSFFGCTDFLAPAVDTHPARVTVEMEVVVPEALCKRFRPDQVILNRIVVTLVSSKQDTLKDLITEAGSVLSRDPETFLAGSVASQIVSARYDLAPDRTWKIRTQLYDGLDSLRQLDSLKVPALKAFENRTVALCLHPRLSAYNAHLFLPSDILVRETGHDAESRTATREVYFSRIVLLDGTAVKVDTSAVEGNGAGFKGADPAVLFGASHSVFFPSGSFDETPSVGLEDDYVNNGTHTFVLKAYGYIEGDTVGVTRLRLLFEGNQLLNTALAKEAGAVAMEWKATDIAVPADTSTATRVKVVLGRVGTLIMNVRISGALDI
jgi:hypothetical protein